MTSQTIFSAKINKHDGMDTPKNIEEIPGWSVFKMEQTEVYEITHNLNLEFPEKELHVVATSMSQQIRVIVDHVDTNTFMLSTWKGLDIPASTDLMFVAVLNTSNKPNPPSGIKFGS